MKRVARWTTGGSSRNSTATDDSTHTSPSIPPDTQPACTCCASQSPAPPPSPEPPRFPAWLQPPARPFSSSGVECAISASAAMRVETRCNAEADDGEFDGDEVLRGAAQIAAVAAISNPMAMAEIRNHTLLLSVVSTIGAQTNFHVCGEQAPRYHAATAATPMPACVSR